MIESIDTRITEQIQCNADADADAVQVLALAGLSQPQLEEKAKEIWQWLYRLESEKYDLEQRNKRQRDDLTELAERARQISNGGY